MIPELTKSHNGSDNQNIVRQNIKKQKKVLGISCMFGKAATRIVLDIYK
jgi:hypothetical protein